MDTIAPRVIDRLGCPTCFAAMYTQAEVDRDLCDDCNDRHTEN